MYLGAASCCDRGGGATRCGRGGGATGLSFFCGEGVTEGSRFWFRTGGNGESETLGEDWPLAGRRTACAFGDAFGAALGAGEKPLPGAGGEPLAGPGPRPGARDGEALAFRRGPLTDGEREACEADDGDPCPLLAFMRTSDGRCKLGDLDPAPVMRTSDGRRKLGDLDPGAG